GIVLRLRDRCCQRDQRKTRSNQKRKTRHDLLPRSMPAGSPHSLSSFTSAAFRRMLLVRSQCPGQPRRFRRQARRVLGSRVVLSATSRTSVSSALATFRFHLSSWV